jgi:hypothetical protein
VAKNDKPLQEKTKYERGHKMKIIYVAPSPRAGQIDHLQPHRAQALIDSGFAQAVPYKNYIERLQEEESVRQHSLNPNPVYAQVTFAVCQGAISGRYYISGRCSAAQCSSFIFDGAPSSSLEKLTFTHSCGCGHPETVPAAIVAQYRKLYKPVTKYGNDEALALTLGAPQPSKPVDLSTIIGPAQGQALVEGCEKEGLLNYLPNPTDGKRVEPKTYLFSSNEK